MARTKTAKVGSWLARYDGGRLADIYHEADGYRDAVDCIQVVSYDWQTGTAGTLRPGQLRLKLQTWARNHGGEYETNVVAFRR